MVEELEEKNRISTFIIPDSGGNPKANPENYVHVPRTGFELPSERRKKKEQELMARFHAKKEAKKNDG